jgi:hypothetical protein
MTVVARSVITAENASFLRAWDGAARGAELGSKRIIGAAAGIKTAVNTIVGSAIVAGLTSMVRSQVLVIDSFNDLSDATGASIENISGLENLGRRTGTTFESVGGILVKFNAALKDAKPDNDAGQAFRALGLDLERLRQLDPVDALQKTATALQGFANDGTKARIVQEFFSKSIREAAPFLKDLAESGGLMATVTRKQAEEVERFNKQLMALKANTDEATRSIVSGLIPALNGVLEKWNKEGTLAVLGFDSKFFESKALADKTAELKRYQGSIAKLEQDLREGRAGRSTALGTPEEIEANLAQLRPAFERAKREFRDMYAATRGYTLNSAAGAGRGVVNPELVKPSLVLAGKSGKPRKEEISEASTRLASYVDQLSKAAEKTADLSEEQKALNFLLSLGSTGEVPQVRELVQGLAIRRDIAEREDEIGRIRAKNDAAAVGAVAARSAENDQLAERLVNMALEIEEIGLTAEALDRLKLTRLDNALAQEQLNLVDARSREGNELTIDQIERRINLLQRERELAGQGVGKRADAKLADESKEAAAVLHQDVKSALANAFRDTENPVKAFGAALGNVVFTRVSDAAANALATALVGTGKSGSTGGLLGSLVTSLFGGFRASGGPVAPNTLYRVNERGPELLETSGRQYLMMGNRGGNVVPNRGGGGGGGGIVHNHYYNFTVGDVATVSMVRAAVAGSQARALAEMQRSRRLGGAWA